MSLGYIRFSELTLEQAAMDIRTHIVTKDGGVDLDMKRVAMWLEELMEARKTIQDIRTVLADVTPRP